MPRDIETMLRESAQPIRPRPSVAAPSELRRRGDRRRSARRGGAIAAVLAVVAGVALGVSGLHSSAPTPPAQRIAWTRAQGCDYWQTAAAPFGQAWGAMRAARNKQLTGSASWQTVRDATDPFGPASRKFAEQLLSPPQPWPTPLDKAAPPSASFYLAEAAWAERVSRATTETDFNTVWAQDPMAGDLPVTYSDAATLVKQACSG
jgi:hypothetical protein